MVANSNHWCPFQASCVVVLTTSLRTHRPQITCPKGHESLFHKCQSTTCDLGPSPVQYNNSSGVISMPAATTSTSGYLTSTDWTTFNNKQNHVTGTANSFAGFDGAGELTTFSNWIRNSFYGASVVQAPSPTDPGFTQSFPLNDRTITITPTNNLSNSYIWGDLNLVNLDGTNDYLGVTGNEYFIQQTGATTSRANSWGFPAHPTRRRRRFKLKRE